MFYSFKVDENFTVENMRSLIIDLETEVNKRHPSCDHHYRKKITDTVENLKLLKEFPDIAELIVIKKTISVQKLIQSHPAFKDGVQNVRTKLAEKKRARGGD